MLTKPTEYPTPAAPAFDASAFDASAFDASASKAPASSIRQKLIERSFQTGLTDEQNIPIVYGLIIEGLIDRAQAVLAKMAPDSAPVLRQIAAQIEQGETLLHKAIPGLVTQQDKKLGRNLTGILVIPSTKPNAPILFVFGVPSIKFFMPAAISHRRDLHLIFIHDPYHRFSLCGVPRLGSKLPETLARLKKLLALLKHTAVYCLGGSAGGYSALKFGLQLGAHGVAVMGSPISLKLDDDPGAKMSKYPQLKPLYEVDRDLGTNLAEEYAQQPIRPRVMIVYGAKNRRDSYFAQFAAGLPGAKLMPLPGERDHLTLAKAQEKALLPGLLKELFTLKRYPN